MRHWLVSFALVGLADACAAQALPAEFDHNRIWLVVHADDGPPLKFYTDSGGGFNAITREVADRLKLASAGATEGDGATFALVEFPAAVVGAGVPAPLPDPGLKGRLAIAPAAMLAADGFLGSPWFAGRAWRIDYGHHQMALLHDWKAAAGDHEIALGFQVDDDGARLQNMPRMTITVAGRPLDVLLDTGATFHVTDDSAPAFEVSAGAQVGGGFIMKSIFDDWHATHPDWRVIAQGDALQGKSFPMIEVPRVSVAGYTVGPVWFAQRPDRNFAEMMSSFTDKPVVGAFGGSGLQYFHVVLDYPRARAWFGLN